MQPLTYDCVELDTSNNSLSVEKGTGMHRGSYINLLSSSGSYVQDPYVQDRLGWVRR